MGGFAKLGDPTLPGGVVGESGGLGIQVGGTLKVGSDPAWLLAGFQALVRPQVVERPKSLARGQDGPMLWV